MLMSKVYKCVCFFTYLLSLTRVCKNKQLFAAFNVTVKGKQILGYIVCKCANEQGE